MPNEGDLTVEEQTIMVTSDNSGAAEATGEANRALLEDFSETTSAKSINRFWYALTLLCALGGLLLWLAFWRYPVLLPDDYFFAARGGEPFGGVTLSGLFESARIDLFERNGRIADVFVEMLFGLSKTPTRMLLGILAWSPVPVLAFVIHRIFPKNLYHGVKVFLATVAVTFLPFFLIDVNPYWGASLYYFASAVVGYLGGLTLLLGTLALTVKLAAQGQELKARWCLGLFLLSVLAGLFHEMIAAALLGTAIMLGALGIVDLKSPDPRRSRMFLGIIMGLPSMVRFFAPGIWSRKDKMDAEESGLRELLGEINITAMQIGNRHLVILVLFVALLAVLGLCWRGPTIGERRLVRVSTATTVVSAAIWLATAFYNDTRFASQPAEIASSRSASIGTIFAVLTIVLSLLIILVVSRYGSKSSGLFLVATFASFSATFAFTSLTGSGVARAGFFPTALLYMSTLALAFHFMTLNLVKKDVLLKQASSMVVAGIAVAFLFVGVPRASSDFLDLRANAKVWNASVDLIEQSRVSDEQVEILLPGSLPRPGVVSWKELGHNSGVLYRLGIYYDLPDNVTVEWAN